MTKDHRFNHLHQVFFAIAHNYTAMVMTMQTGRMSLSEVRTA